MKTNSSFTKLLVAVLVATLALYACKKQDDASGKADKEEFASVSSESDAAAEVVFDDIFNNVMGVSSEVAIGGTGVFGRVDVSSGASGNRVDGADSVACYTVTTKQLSTSTRFPLQITIDFGSGCIGKDGRTRKGKIIVIYTGHLGTSGNSATASFDGYYLDNLKVEGVYKLTNTGTTSQRSYTTQIINAKLSGPNGDYIEWSSEKTITQIEGGSTPLLALDDVYNITGQASGAVSAGNKYLQWSTVITAALRKKFGCRWITLGTLSLKKGNDAVAVLDYGTGTCDNKATFTVNGVVHEITLH